MAFFLIHGLAVAATARLAPRGAAAVAGVVLTAAFNVATLVVFAASLDAMVAGLVRLYPHGGALP